MLIFVALAACRAISPTPTFNAERAFADVEHQLSLGPRTPSSSGHDEIVVWLDSELTRAGWDVSLQENVQMGHSVLNIIARRGPENVDPILLGAHYDTRLYADEDATLENQSKPVPGANDGASGVAVLLELARALPEDASANIWLVFFDAEDNGQIPGWDWILGSRAFVENMEQRPQAVVIVDMIGDRDLNIHQERNSTPLLRDDIWNQAEDLGYAEYFLPTPKYSMLDDHTPFLEAGIPAVDIIDFDYPYWHTIEDTLDKVSAQSLQVVGDTLLAWLISQ